MKLLLHNLIGIGPSSFARFMAGCTCEQLDTVEMADYYTKKLVHTGVSPHSAREQAFWLVTKKNEANDPYRVPDELGLEGEGPQFSFTDDGDIRFSGYPETLHAMYENQREKRPKQYNQEEHQTVLSAYQALQNGANQAAHIVHQYDGQGKLDLRDVVVLTFDHQTNTGRMHILNISQEGKNHTTLESARDVMQKRLGGFEEKVKTDSVFLFVREQTPVDPVSLFRERKIIRLTPIQPAKEAIPQLRTVLNADKDSHIPFRIPFFLQRLMGRDEKGKLIQQKDKKEKKNKNIEKQEQKVDEKKKAVVIAQQTGVGIGGAFVILDALKEPVKPITKKEKRELRKMKKEIKTGRHKEIKIQRSKEIKRRKRKETRLASRSGRESRRAKTQANKETKRLRNKETVNMIFSRKEKKRSVDSKEKRKKENSGLRAKELGLIAVLGKITRKIRKEGILTKGKQERKIIRPKEAVGRSILEFTRAWILFMLFRHSFIEKQQYGKKENVIFIGKTNKEEKTIHEFSPWILLSIIWYLTMIREQGKAAIIQKKKKKNKRHGKKKRKLLRARYSQWISQQGIIYAYLS